MLILAWIVYFSIWGMSFLVMRAPKSKVIFALIAIVSLADIVYLGIYDLRVFLMVILATCFAITGMGRAIAFGMRASKEN